MFINFYNQYFYYFYFLSLIGLNGLDYKNPYAPIQFLLFSETGYIIRQYSYYHISCGSFNFCKLKIFHGYCLFQQIVQV